VQSSVKEKLPTLRARIHAARVLAPVAPVAPGRWNEEEGMRIVDYREMHIYAFLPFRKKQRSFARKKRLPMKKSNVRFFHGEPVFSDT
jgi:hypothetical protein